MSSLKAQEKGKRPDHSAVVPEALECQMRGPSPGKKRPTLPRQRVCTLSHTTGGLIREQCTYVERGKPRTTSLWEHRIRPGPGPLMEASHGKDSVVWVCVELSTGQTHPNPFPKKKIGVSGDVHIRMNE